MKNKKLSGSFYTPKPIADFLVDYISNKFVDATSISVLEPSSGDGVFIKSIYDNKTLSGKVSKVVAVEISKIELNKISNAIKSDSFISICSDFLKYQNKNMDKFSLVIGNPPYIKKNYLKKNQLEYCKTIHNNASLSDNNPKNIWTSFLVRGIKFTDANGILAFVLPSELLQVKFAKELRELIIKEFERVEIFTFNELLFKACKGQDTLLLICERKAKDKGVFYCNVDKYTDLADRNFTLSQNVKIKESKWTHHHLSTDEIDLLEKLKETLKTINYYCSSKAGIVTAANNYFIIDNKTVADYSLESYVKPIIQKGSFINCSVVLTKEEFQTLITNSKPTFLLSLDKNSVIRENAKIWHYLQIGKDNKIDKRYKSKIRTKWYEIPNIGIPTEGMFFKRCNEYPKLIKNEANVLATDSAYLISMNDQYKIENLIYSFYNSLTLAFSELYGRYYGGGVLELTPNEFKNLPIPYLEIAAMDFNSFAKDFKNMTSIKDICKRNDTIILKSIDSNLDKDSIEKIYNIREKLYLGRIKTN
jgi:adenine-specific DNA-methyltransferase